MTWRHFSYETDPMLACSCCGEQGMDDAFMRVMDRVRDKLAQPIMVTSGYRCPAHNAEVSSTGEDGPHTTGRAIDIQLNGPAVWQLVAEARAFGLHGIGLKQSGDWANRFVHLDNLTVPDHPRPRVWTYNAD